MDVAEREADQIDLSENEGLLLSLSVRLGSVTAHQLYLIFEGSPLGSLNASKGSVYPIVRRLKERGLLIGKPVPNDGRRSELLMATEKGREAVKSWVARITSTHILPADPLRARLPSLDLLSRDEQLQWISRAKQLNHAKADEVREYAQRTSFTFDEVVHNSALLALAAQARWLDELLAAVLAGGVAPRPTRVADVVE